MGNEICPMCRKRPVPAGSKTCGNSYCQEAAFYESKVWGFRSGSTARERAVRIFQEKKTIAEEHVR